MDEQEAKNKLNLYNWLGKKEVWGGRHTKTSFLFKQNSAMHKEYGKDFQGSKQQASDASSETLELIAKKEKKKPQTIS